ncbi:hypothetical protein BC830DRAFT_198265 [Chytriomyces sp. MP71]|nr:hypothetical protein BC830DRAFT_198265 [Chytriomyces sp. MP71]
MEDQKCYESMHWIQKSELNAQPVPFSATLNNEDPRSILEVPSDFDALRDSGIVVACTAPDSLLPMQSRHQKNTDSSETADSTPGASLHANLHDEETCGPPPHHVHSHNNAPESSSHEMNDGCNPAAFLTGSDFLPPVASPSSPVNYNSPSIKHKNALQREVEDSCIVEMEGYSMLASPLQESCDKTAPTTSGPLHLPALSPVDDEKSAEQPPMLQPLYDEMHLVAESRDTKIEHVLTEPLLSDVGAGCGVTSIVTHQFDCDEKSDMEQKQIKGSFTAEVKLAPLGSLQVFETCQDQVEALLRGPLSNEVGAPGSSMADLSHSLGSIINHGENAQDMSEVTGLVVEEPAEPMRCVLESMPIPMPSEETPGNFDVTTTVIPMNPSERDPNSDSTKPSVISLHEYVTESVDKDSSDVRGVNDVARREISLDAAMTDFPSVESEGGMDLLPTQHFIRHSFPENASFAFASASILMRLWTFARMDNKLL